MRRTAMIFMVGAKDAETPGDTVRVEVTIREDAEGVEYLGVLALDGCTLEVGDDAEPSTMAPPIYAH